eukprot:6444555-Amphidinium_carterae.1
MQDRSEAFLIGQVNVPPFVYCSPWFGGSPAKNPSLKGAAGFGLNPTWDPHFERSPYSIKVMLGDTPAAAGEYTTLGGLLSYKTPKAILKGFPQNGKNNVRIRFETSTLVNHSAHLIFPHALFPNI